METQKVTEVFKTVGLPPFTYVKPVLYGEIRTDIEQPGKHLVIEGPSGIGKTCVVYKVFEEFNWTDGTDYRYLSCRDESSEPKLVDSLNRARHGEELGVPIMVLDDFHFLSESTRTTVGSQLKEISDRAFKEAKPTTFIFIGIPAAGGSLVTEAYDLGPRLGVFRLERASDDEIRKLISEGEEALNVLFEDDDILLSEIEGNFWLAQYICQKVCASAEVYHTAAETQILAFDLLTIRKRLHAELSPRYSPVAVTFSKGNRWRPGGNKPYLEILLALKRIPDSVVTFDRVMTFVPDRRKPGIRAVRGRVSTVIYNPDKQIDLRKHIAFESDSFSIEDPLFRYYLTHLDPDELFRGLGIESDAFETAKIYPYDIGFSFAGEARLIVECVNEALKEEDVVTFYDYDQQAFLLAHELQETLSRIYSSSCRFYLVFLDANYKEKVWTRFEKEIMTQKGRSNHIIPVILDEEGAAGVVDIPKTLGRIDLRDIWTDIEKEGEITTEAFVTIKNRCVIPILQKIDVPDDHGRP